MRTLAIYGGRFQPAHLGHMSSYEYLVDKFGADNVYEVTADPAQSEDDPFSYGEKTAMLAKLGIPTSHIVVPTDLPRSLKTSEIPKIQP